MDKDLLLLAEHSDLAKSMLNNYSKIRYYDIFTYGSDVSYDYSTFHPNGKCGCIEVDDDYLFGIRCNHLMWSEGEVESAEPCVKEDEWKDAILIYGNHKGGLEIKLIISH